MTETKWTPGPWAVKPKEIDKSYVRIRGTCLGRRFKIANVICLDYEGVPNRETEENDANANLIVAAPDMYAALKMVSGMDLHHEVLAVVDAAMRKARGE